MATTVRRRILAILDWCRDVLPPVVGTLFDERLLLHLLVWNVLGFLALAKLMGWSAESVKEFGSTWTLAVVCAAVAEFDLVQLIRRRPRKGSTLFFLILLPIGLFALGLDYHMHADRLSADAHRAEAQQWRDDLNARLNSPEFRQGLAAMARIDARHRRPTTARDPGGTGG